MIYKISLCGAVLIKLSHYTYYIIIIITIRECTHMMQFTLAIHISHARVAAARVKTMSNKMKEKKKEKKK